ncbi:MAG: helix-turn-helix domain-containing protein [Kiritimatiellia bacterium]
MDMSEYIGEATSYDKKLMLERKEPLSWLKSISAFANTSGGLLLYGVDNDGNPVGLGNAERDAEGISEMIKSLMDPIPEFDLSLHDEEGRKFIVVSVKAGTTTPYYVFLKGHRDAYIRIGNESVKANSIDLKRLVLKGEKRTWDSLPSNHKRANFAFETLRAEYFARAKIEFAESDFDSFGLVEGSSLTNAGAEVAAHAFSTTLAEGRNAKVIIHAMRANGRVTILDLCRKTRLSTNGVYKIIAALKAASKIRRVGPTKGGCWEVTDSSMIPSQRR